MPDAGEIAVASLEHERPNENRTTAGGED